MVLRSLALVLSLSLAIPALGEFAPAEAGQTVKKKVSPEKKRQRYKKNFQGTRPGQPNYAELPDNCWGAKWDGKDWLCFNSFDFNRFDD